MYTEEAWERVWTQKWMDLRSHTGTAVVQCIGKHLNFRARNLPRLHLVKPVYIRDVEMRTACS